MSPRRRRSGGPPRQVVVIAAIAAVVLGGLWILLSTGGGARDAEAAGPVIDDPTVSESELALATGRSTSTGGSTRAIMPPVEREPRETSTRSNNDNTGSGTGGTASSLGDALRNGGRQEPEARVVNTGVETQTPRQTPNETTQTTQPMRAGGGRVAELVSAAAEQIEGDEPIVARELLNRALATPGIEPAESVRVRTMLSALNRQLVFGPTIFEGDPMTEAYEVQSGDSLARIARRRELATDWRLVQRVNELSNPNRIRVG
ncbi:MAG: LysM peptidoglycan-binding domain-containing protein, partial [Planctomycetota bacterium]